MKIFAPAKINLSLQVSPPINDGSKYNNYHKLDSLVAFTKNIGDNLFFELSQDLELFIEGPFANGLSTSDNLIIKAANSLLKYTNTNKGAKIILEKNLPVASGIGGGSTDCAASLLGLNQLWELGLNNDELCKIGLEIGADVPACINKQPLIMRNIGDEILEAENFTNIPIILANPLIECPTPLIYKAYDKTSIKEFNYFSYYSCVSLQNTLNMIKKTSNDLEPVAISLFPKIGKLIDDMSMIDGVSFVRMSGSGASVFAAFESEEYAKNGLKLLKQAYGDSLWANFDYLVGKNG